MKMASDEAVSLLRKFYQLQEERVQTYLLFEEGHNAYLASAPNYNFPMYRQLVHEITQTFRKISADIIELKEMLVTEHDHPEVANFIGKVQEEEEKKLEMTIKLQLAKQDMIENPNDITHQEEMHELKQSIQDVIERINEHLEELKYESEDLMTE